MQGVGETIRDGPVAGDIDADAFRVAGGDEFTQRLPLRIEVTTFPG